MPVRALMLVVGVLFIGTAGAQTLPAIDVELGLQVDDLPAVQDHAPDHMPSFAPGDHVHVERSVQIVGSLSPSEVDAALRPHRVALRECGDAPTELRLAVSADGAVTGADVAPADTPSVNCIVAIARTIAFPRLAGGGVAVVQVPLN
ncbi:MAG: hypothetical protein ACI9K2_001588 [Myxococcota bacterium]|jgi:hypothetical protein